MSQDQISMEEFIDSFGEEQEEKKEKAVMIL